MSVWDCNALDTVACAGTQGGKTAVEPHWLLREIQRCAPLILSLRNGKFIYAGPTLELLKDQAIPTFKELFEEQEQLGKLVEGNKPYFRFSRAGLKKVFGFEHRPVRVTFKYTKDSSNLESMTALAGVWDEAGQKENKFASYGAFNRRLKVARSTTFADVEDIAPDWWREWYFDAEGAEATFGRRLWGTTPYEWNWFKNEVYDRADKGRDGFELRNWPSWLSPRVSEEECVKEQSRIPLWQWEMMYLGHFTRPAGAIYDTFDYELDSCEDFPIPAHWAVYPGVDFGSANMGGVLVAEDPESRVLYVVKDYLQGQRTFTEHAAALRGSYSVRVGAGGSHQEEGWREAFRSNGLPLDEPPVGSVEVGIGCVYAEIKQHRLVVFRSCGRLLTEIGTYSREIKDGKPTEEIANKSSYHTLDALRYIVSKLRPNKPPDVLPLRPSFGFAKIKVRPY